VQLELASQGKVKDWLDNGRKLYKRYKSEKVATTARNNAPRRFNILFSNTEVLRAALYGKAAKPDVRRRFGDMDVTARSAAEIVERALIYCAESYDVDKPIEASLLDYLIPGRAMVRIEYEPVIKTRPVIDPDDGPAHDGRGWRASDRGVHCRPKAAGTLLVLGGCDYRPGPMLGKRAVDCLSPHHEPGRAEGQQLRGLAGHPA
jgi:hypothetical protein